MGTLLSLSGITIGHVALLLGRMMRQTMSLIGFWENDADVSTFWVRPVERSPLIRTTLGVPAWAAKRKWNLLCILHTFFHVYTAWFLTKKPTWPDVWKLKYIVVPETYCNHVMGLKLKNPSVSLRCKSLSLRTNVSSYGNTSVFACSGCFAFW